MATIFHIQPASPRADAERFVEALTDLRTSTDHLEQYARVNPDVSRTGLSRLRTIAATAREFAAIVAPSHASHPGAK